MIKSSKLLAGTSSLVTVRKAAKLAVKVSDLSMRRIISQDYTTRYKTVDEDGNYVPATEETKDEGL